MQTLSWPDIPMVASLSRPGFERVISGGLVTLSGKIVEGDTITYITRGTGTSNLDIELRFLSPPEIVYITPPQNGGTGKYQQ